MDNDIKKGDMVVVIKNIGDAEHNKYIGRIATVLSNPFMFIEKLKICYFLDIKSEEPNIDLVFAKEELLKINPQDNQEITDKVVEKELEVV